MGCVGALWQITAVREELLGDHLQINSVDSMRMSVAYVACNADAHWGGMRRQGRAA